MHLYNSILYRCNETQPLVQEIFHKSRAAQMSRCRTVLTFNYPLSKWPIIQIVKVSGCKGVRFPVDRFHYQFFKCLLYKHPAVQVSVFSSIQLYNGAIVQISCFKTSVVQLLIVHLPLYNCPLHKRQLCIYPTTVVFIDRLWFLWLTVCQLNMMISEKMIRTFPSALWMFKYVTSRKYTTDASAANFVDDDWHVI